MIFWIASGFLILITATMLLRPIARVPRMASLAGSELAFRKAQLREIDQDIAKGLISTSEAETLRAEIGRRVLLAEKAMHEEEQLTSSTSALPHRALAATMAALFIFGTTGLYLFLGSPGERDLGQRERIRQAEERMATRLSQAEAEAQFPDIENVNIAEEHAELMERMREVMRDRPNDLRGQTLLMQNEARIGRFPAAHAAQQRVIAIKGQEAAEGDYTMLAELMILSARGYISPEAESALRSALSLNPRSETARFYLGRMYAQNDRPDHAFQLWERLLMESPPNAPWVPEIRENLEVIAQMAGIRYNLPPLAALPGPDEAAIASASELTMEERIEMVQSMVASLESRLANQGGDAAEWERLIRSLHVLNETSRAEQVLAQVKLEFAEHPEIIARLEAAHEAAHAESRQNE